MNFYIISMGKTLGFGKYRLQLHHNSENFSLYTVPWIQKIENGSSKMKIFISHNGKKNHKTL